MKTFLSAIFFGIAANAIAADFRVTDFGAANDGVTLATRGIQAAIDAAAAAGGGTVIVPKGIFLSGSIFVKSNVRFVVSEGAEIRGVQDDKEYPEMKTRIAGIEMVWPAALINVCNATNVVVEGKGSIDGQGSFWWKKFWGEDGKGGMMKDYVARGLRWAVDYDCKRVRLVQVYESSGVALRGLTLKRPGFWTVHICYSRDVTADGLTIRANIGGKGPSSDGIDIDSSRDVLVQNCDIDCNDDTLCLKAGRDADGLRVNRPTENVVLRDCVIRGGQGLFTIGSETSGGIRHVEAYRLKAVADTGDGIRFKSARTRGGVIEDINIHDIEMDGVSRPIVATLNWYPKYSYAKIPDGMTNVPEHWKTLAKPVPPEKALPHFRDIRIANVHAKNAKKAFEVEGYAEAPVQNVALENVDIEAAEPGRIRFADGWTAKDVRVVARDGKKVRLENCENMKLPESVFAAGK